MSDPKNLYEAMAQTEPGRHAHYLSDLVYNHGHALGDTNCARIYEARDYLERLAHEELRRRVPPWVRELAARKPDTEEP